MTLEPEMMLEINRRLCLSREFEQALITYATKDAKPIGHPYLGQEGVGVGVCTALRPTDRIMSTHRSHGHAVAKGCDLDKLALELYGSGEGSCRGRAGEMFVAQTDVGYFGGTQIVAGNLAMVTGVGLAAKLDKADRIAVGFVGDGGVNQGVFHEAVNLAAIWSLPVIIVVENNGYAQTTTPEYATAGDMTARAASYGIAAVAVDGQSAVDVHEATATARRRAVAGEGPTLIEARTYRFEGHYYGDRHRRYRGQEEVESWLERDPLMLHRQQLLALGVDEAVLEEQVEVARAVSQAAFERARTGAPARLEDLLEDVTVDSYPTAAERVL